MRRLAVDPNITVQLALNTIRLHDRGLTPSGVSPTLGGSAGEGHESSTSEKESPHG